MKDRYDPKEIEPRWQKYWEETKLFHVTEDPNKEKFYCLEMFPYPSGRIHMGHVRNYSIGDLVARYKIMRGYNVLHPMGWDAFGMPAENAAIKEGVHPAKWTFDNIRYMRMQLKKMGFSYDWDREIASCHPGYYKWSQWIFLKMYEHGLVYQSRALVNWCDTCGTSLSNEQVLPGGICWRGHTETPVVLKELDGQWFIRITAYAEELLKGIEELSGYWPERVLTMQKNWIGRSEGTEVDFPRADGGEPIKIFTTRQDTLFGATFMLLAPEHPLCKELSRGKPQEREVDEFIKAMARVDRAARTDEAGEKMGVFTGSYAINPMTREKIPVWIANFVLMEYGTGAIMAVPAHDQRDLDFARKYGLPVRVVIQPPDGRLDEKTMTEAYTEEGHLVNSGQFSGMPSDEAREAIAHYLEQKGIGRRTVNYRMRDWGISRQRYWGTPIPMIHCPNCGVVPVPYEDLPVILPLDLELLEGGLSPLPHAKEFYQVKCPRCGGEARRETDTMDTFVCSSWYFNRYCCPRYEEGPLDRSAVDYWMPVDQYIGGIEHAILHLLYSRFWTMFLRDIGLIKVGEPYKRLLTQGMVLNKAKRGDEEIWVKMSKSLGNVVDPDDIIEKYGADTVRLFILSDSPPEKDMRWSDEGVAGAHRFLNRIWRLVKDNLEAISSVKPYDGKHSALSGTARKLNGKINETIHRFTRDVDGRWQFNTAIASLYELFHELSRVPAEGLADDTLRAVFRKGVEVMTILLSVICPHICEEIWRELGYKESIIKTPWPEADPEALQKDMLTIVVQVNGKVRSKLALPADSTDEEIKRAAISDQRVKHFTGGREPKKVILVPKKLVNVVV